MIKKAHQVVMIIVVFATLTTGCKNLNEKYAKFANAMSGYSTALDKLLKVSEPIAVEATSEQLIQVDTDQKQDFQVYKTNSAEDIERLELLTHLRTHTRLLGQYFHLLYELASSNAPERTAKEVENVVSGLESVSQQLISSKKFPTKNFSIAKKVVPSLANIAVNSKINSALKAELEKRKQTIQNQILLQQVLLAVITDDLKADLDDIQQLREVRLVSKPYGDTKIPLGEQQSWINKRGMVMNLRSKMIELEETREIAGEFRKVFEDFIKGKLNSKSVENITQRMNNIIEVAQTVPSK